MFRLKIFVRVQTFRRGPPCPRTTSATLALRQLWDIFETTLRQLLPRFLPVTCSNTASAVLQLRDNCKTTLGQLCDNFETTVRQLWDNFETSLKQLLPGLLPVTWSNTSSSVIQSPSSTFSRLLLLVFFTYMTLFEYASAILDWTHVLHSQNVKQ